ncbi:MAG: long-chain fatty acid--CoA ligase [Bacteroidia bacterium]
MGATITRVFDILDIIKSGPNNTTLLNKKISKKEWKAYSSEDFISLTNKVSIGLLELGLKSGDIVAILSTNRPEWNMVDYGCQQVGIVTAPIFPTISSNDLKFILNHCEAKALFVSDKSLYKKLADLSDELPYLKFVFSFNEIEGVKHFDDFLKLGEANRIEEVEKSKRGIQADDLLTILYTSGTTGIPKGVMLSHGNLASNIMACIDIVPFESKWKTLSFLPLNHVYERMVSSLYLYHGCSIYYLEQLELLGDTAKEIHPTIFVAVPRLIERVHEKIMTAGEKLTGFSKKIFDWSVNIANQYEGEGQHGLWYNVQRSILDKLVYKKWRAAVGGELRFLVSGGAALNARLERVFSCAGITILQGYGLTETSPVISVNRLGKGNAKYGTVGPVIKDCEVKIAEEDGEILTRGPNKMLGYYKNPEATAEVIDSEGWLHTGDIGTFVDNKFLKITDRKKEIFKTSAGKYIAPVAIENKLKECKYVENCMVVGEGQKFASALIVPSFANFKDYCSANNIEWKDQKEMSKHEDLKKIINTHIKEINKSLAAFEQLKRCEILDREWSIDAGELTPKLSLKRKVLSSNFKSEIEKIFSVD